MKLKCILLFVLFIMSYCTDRETVGNKELFGNDFRLFKKTPVWELAKAVCDEDTSLIKKLIISDNLDVNFKEPKFGQTLIMLSVKNGKYNSLMALLNFGADPNIHDDYDGSSAIIDASGYNSESRNDLRIMKLLLKYGSDPNDMEVGKRQDGNTRRDFPLLKASETSIEKVELLLANGANVNLSNEFGTTALSAAIMQDKLDIVFILIKNGADFKKPVLEREGDSLYLIDLLRELDPPFYSKEYREKKEIIDFLKSNGVEH